MKFSKVTAVYFSPTGNARCAAQTVAEALADRLGLPCAELDITLPESRTKEYSFGTDELVVFASPTYAGRLPNKMQPTFAGAFHGEGTAAVPMALFGNRSFQDALSELGCLLRQNGFVPVGGASVVSEHVFSDKLAPGRPDAEDKAALARFAQTLADRLASAEALTVVTLPGNDPVGPYYTPLGVDGQPAKFLKAKPLTDAEKCNKCGICAAACPMGSIEADCVTVTGVCVKCQACVRKCPTGAKYFEDPAFLSHKEMLVENFTARKENEFFI